MVGSSSWIRSWIEIALSAVVLAADQLWGTAVRRYGQRQAPIEVAL